MAREKLQQEILAKTDDYFSRNPQGILFSEIRTGTGKTKLLLDRAASRVEQTGKSVIVSSSNNYLAMEFLSEAEKFGHGAVSVVIGKRHYVDMDIVRDPAFLSAYGLLRDEVEAWAENNQGHQLVLLFMEAFALLDEADELIGGGGESDAGLDDFYRRLEQSPGVYITNHHFLLLALTHRKDALAMEYDIYVDEAHLLFGTALSLYRDSFSPFRTRFLLNEHIASQEVGEAAKREYRKLAGMLSDLLDVSRAGYLSNAAEETHFKRFAELVESKAWSNCVKRLSAEEKKNKGIAHKIRPELAAGTAVLRKMRTNRKSVSADFSTVRFYVSFATHEENPAGRLRSAFANHTGAFWGVSGTIRVSESLGVMDNLWSIERCGFYAFRKPESERAVRFNARVAGLSLQVYPSPFGREQARYHAVTEKRFHPPKGRGAKDTPLYGKWADNLAELADEAMWRNGLILMSSFENVALLRDALLRRGFDKRYRIFAHTLGVPMRRVVRDYKKAIDAGEQAVLIGGLGFYTGVDLHGDYLHTLFIGKLPIEPMGTAFSGFRYGRYSAQAEMRKRALLTFRQGIGRAIRGPEERAFIVVADPRIHNARYNIFLRFLNEMAVPYGE